MKTAGLCLERLTRREDGKLEYRLKKPASNGATSLVLPLLVFGRRKWSEGYVLSLENTVREEDVKVWMNEERALPVVEQGRLVGMLTSTDCLATLNRRD